MLLDCVDRGLDIFGSTVKSVVYWHFSSKFKLERRDIPRKSEIFSECLGSIFSSRANVVEQCIVAEIMQRFHVELPSHSSINLTDAIGEARKQIGATIR